MRESESLCSGENQVAITLVLRGTGFPNRILESCDSDGTVDHLWDEGISCHDRGISEQLGGCRKICYNIVYHIQ
jgi:hypothetical protein